MSRRFPNLIWLAVALACGTALANEGIRWAPDIPTGRQAAAQFKVPLLIHFYSDQSLTCQTLDQRVLNKPEIIETLNRFFICVKVNATQNRENMELARDFQVHSWPSDVFVSPDGKTLYQGVCPQDATTYLDTLKNIALMNRDRNIMLSAEKQLDSAMQGDYAAQTTYSGRLQGNTVSYPSSSKTPATPSSFAKSSTEQRRDNQSSTSPPNPSFTQPDSSPSRSVTPSSRSESAPTSGNPVIGNPSIGSAGVASNRVLTTASENPRQTVLDSSAASQLPPASRSQVSTGPLEKGSQPRAIAGAVQSHQQHVPLAHLTRKSPEQGQQSPISSGQSLLNQSSSVGLGNKYELPSDNHVDRESKAEAIATVPSTTSAPHNSNPSPPTSTVSAETRSSKTERPHPQSKMVNNPFYAEQNSPVENYREQKQASNPSQRIPTSDEQSGSSESSQSSTSSRSEASETPDSSPALEGYCPVALRRRGEWVAGQQRFSVLHRGRVYWLSSEVVRDEFLENPDANSPVLSGFDPLLFLEEGRLVHGDVQHGLHQKDTGVYLLFSTAASKQKYWERFDHYTALLQQVLQQAAEN